MYCNDLPESHLQIGETVFYQFFQDMDMDMITPLNWDLKEDPIYYTTINGQVVLYNDITREVVTWLHCTKLKDDEQLISELIKSLAHP
jgi:hypothetical protein